VRALIPVAVLVVAVALVAALAGASVFGGAARRTVVSGPTDTAVVITFTPAEMAGAARAGAGAASTVPPTTTTTSGGPATTTTVATVDTGTQIARSTSTTKAPPPSTTRTTAAPLAGSRGEYVVKVGDTPASIAEKLGVSTAELMRVNGITDPTNLAVGAVLQVPSP
jgi:LysM repeat protein